MVKTNNPARRFASCCAVIFHSLVVNRNIPNFYTGTSVKKIMEVSTEAFADIGTSPLCALQDCACVSDRACRLHLQPPTQTCHFPLKI